jgi:hypothetical protein
MGLDAFVLVDETKIYFSNCIGPCKLSQLLVSRLTVRETISLLFALIPRNLFARLKKIFNRSWIYRPQLTPFVVDVFCLGLFEPVGYLAGCVE